MYATVYWNGSVIANVNQPIIYIYVPPKSTIVAPALDSVATATGLTDTPYLNTADPALLSIYSTITGMLQVGQQ